jgi:iron complex transport system substrate-binding protein
MARALQRRGLRLERQPVIGFLYEGVRFEHGFRADLVVEECVLVELKSLECFAPVYRRQVLTYLRLAHLPVGLLLDFGFETMKEGIKRIVNDLPPSARSPLRVNRRSGS